MCVLSECIGVSLLISLFISGGLLYYLCVIFCSMFNQLFATCVLACAVTFDKTFVRIIVYKTSQNWFYIGSNNVTACGSLLAFVCELLEGVIICCQTFLACPK